MYLTKIINFVSITIKYQIQNLLFNSKGLEFDSMPVHLFTELENASSNDIFTNQYY